MSPRILFVSLLITFTLGAQDPPAHVGRLNLINGSVSFQPGGDTQWYPATLNRPLTVGDQLFADTGARAEIHTSGITFRLGSKTAFEFLNLDDRNIQVRLSEGSLNIRVRRLQGDMNVEVDTANQAFTIQRSGEYRIDADPDNNQTSVTVRDGSGEVTTNSGAFGVQPRQQAVVSGQDQVQYNVYSAPGDDDFDGWAQSRDRHDDSLQSSRYVSQDMVGYEDLDDNGSWQSVPEYGEAWIPRSVPADWAPYHYGHWAWIDPWGYSWVDDASWGFAPFHYGRWANFSGRWGWVPGPVAVAPVYAPALVAWFGVGGVGVSVGFGGEGAGWLPLGPRDVYIPAYQASPAYINRINVSNTTVINNVQITNVYNNYTRTGSVPIASYSNRNVAGAAVAVPQNVLAGGHPVQQGAVRMSSNQVASIKSVAAAPRVAPQLPAVQRANVPRPPAAVTSRAIVAKATPPPPPPSFQQRQAALAKNPGHPIPVQQLRQMAPAGASPTRAPVRVVTQARQVTPTVTNKPAPRTGPGGSVSQQPAAQPAPARPVQQAQPSRTFEPPSAQSHPATQAPRAVTPPGGPPPVQAQPNRPTDSARPAQQTQPNRTFEPPAAQSRPATQAPRTVTPQGEQPRVQSQPNRPADTARPAQQAQPSRTFEPPAAQSRPATQAPRTVTPPREQPRVESRPAPTAPNRTPEVPREQSRPAQRAQPTPRAEPPREQPRVQPQPTRPTNPPAQQERRAEPQPRPVQPPAQHSAAPPPQHSSTPPPAKPRPADSKNDKKKDKPPQ